MNIQEKVELAKTIITGIATHDDAEKKDVEGALSDLKSFTSDHGKNGFGDRDKRIKALEAAKAAKLSHKQSTKRGQEELKASKGA